MDRPPYRVALRLCQIAEARWAEVDAAYASVDLITLPPDRFCNLVYAWCVKHIEPKKLEEWHVLLNEPLPWESEAPAGYEEWDDEFEAQTFGAAWETIGG